MEHLSQDERYVIYVVDHTALLLYHLFYWYKYGK